MYSHVYKVSLSIHSHIILVLKTTILIEQNTKDYLKQLGKKGETYDEIICNLISFKTNNSFYDSVYNKEKLVKGEEKN